MLEDLPFTREKMVSQYHREKQEKLKANEVRDYIKERENENRTLFNASTPSKKTLSMKAKLRWNHRKVGTKYFSGNLSWKKK